MRIDVNQVSKKFGAFTALDDVTLEVEDGTSSSFRTLLGTMLIAGIIALTLSWHAVVSHMFLFPETLGIIMAVQLLIGRYTGYRLSELFRFREFIQASEA